MKEVIRWLQEIAYLLYCLAHNEFNRKPPISKEEYIKRVQ